MRDRVVALAGCAFAFLAASTSACSSGRSVGDDPDAGDVDAPRTPDDVAPDAAVDAAPDQRARKLLVIGIGGLRYDKLASANVPSIDGLAARGIMSRTFVPSAPMASTSSGPGWSTIATGVWPDKHGVVDNNFGNQHLADHPDFLSRLETAKPSLRTYLASDWKPLTESPGPIFSSLVDKRVMHDGDREASWPVADARVVADAVAYLATPEPDAAVVYLANVDKVGNSGNTDLAYLGAIATADQQVGQLLAAVTSRPTYKDENWLIIVASDHGQRDGGHDGGPSWQERQAFVVAAGGDLPHTTLPFEARNVDVAPTVLAHFGVAIDPAWDLDGVALGTAPADVFDALAPKLKPATDEHAIPILGWTHDAPAGWTIDNSKMTAGGTAEWQGWSLVSDEFWNLVEPGQSREAFVRNRGVIAVADPDEWDDLDGAAGRGPFDSSLVSPPFDVTPGTIARIRFSSHYLQENDQKGQVLVSFDGGAPYPYLTYGPSGSDTNRGGNVISKDVTVPVQVPAGVHSMVVTWRLYDARNNWYWAIDNPRVE